MVGATILEYTTSWVMEQLFHARWWDYSNFRFNLQGHVCLLGALIFGLGGVGVVLGSQPYVERVTDMIPLPMLHTLVTVLALITIIDLAVTVAGMLEFERVLDSVSQVVQDVAARAGGTWQWGSSAVSDRMRELSRDTVERLRWAVNGVINAQQKRCSSPSRSSRCRIVRTSSTLCANLWARAARIRRFTESRGSAVFGTVAMFCETPLCPIGQSYSQFDREKRQAMAHVTDFKEAGFNTLLEELELRGLISQSTTGIDSQKH